MRSRRRRPPRHCRATDARLKRRLSLEPLEDRRLLAITVDSLFDEADGSVTDGDVSLRDAIALAPAGETINFSFSLSGGTINLTMGELAIRRSLTINASALPGGLTISAAGSDPTPLVKQGDGSRVFHIDDETPANRTVSLRGLTLTGGDVAGRGGAIYSWENLTLDRMVISGNAAMGPQGQGGGVWSRTSGALNITGSTISGNLASGNGGGVWGRGYDSGTVLILNSTVSGNTAGDKGGGAYLDATNSGVVTLADSTISGNMAAGNGGGVYTRNSLGASTKILQSTLSGNSSAKSGGGAWVYVVGVTTTTISHSTITLNTADSDMNAPAVDTGGGVFNTGTGTLVIDHTIIAGNIDPGNHAADLKKSITTQTVRWSLIGNRSNSGLGEFRVGAPDSNGNLVGGPNVRLIDPRLGPLAENGGPTKTHALALTSPAINGGNPNALEGLAGVPTFDQRGAPFQRIDDTAGAVNARVDMGAFELTLPIPQSYVVDILADEDDDNVAAGDLSLREALRLASAFDVVAPTIRFAPHLSGGVIMLTLGELKIVESVIIDGRDLASRITLDGRDMSRVFRINDEVDGDVESVTLAGLVITNGRPSSEGGGAIQTHENLAIIDCDIIDNFTFSGGGAIELQNANRLELTRTTVAGNQAHIAGAIFFRTPQLGPDRQLILNGSMITGNMAVNGAGGIDVDDATITLMSSSISNNTSANTDYFGVELVDSTLVMTNSVVSGNTGGGVRAISSDDLTIEKSQVSGNIGWGIEFRGKRATITDSQISGNADGGMSLSASSTSGDDVTVVRTTVSNNMGIGVQVSNGSRRAAFIDSTFSGNSTVGISGSGRSVTLINSTVSGNLTRGVSASSASIQHSTVTDGVTVYSLATIRNSLVSSAVATAPFIGNVDSVHSFIGPLVGFIQPALADNGGPTRTHALLPNSPAINAGDPAAVAGVGAVPLYDQRGFAFSRVVGGRIDMGAYESGAVSANFDGSDAIDGGDFLAWQRGFGTLAPNARNSMGDANIDGDVDAGDLALWARQFGAVSPAGSAAAVAAVATSSSGALSAELVDLAMASAYATDAQAPPAQSARFRARPRTLAIAPPGR